MFHNKYKNIYNVLNFSHFTHTYVGLRKNLTYTCKLDVKKELTNTTFQLETPRISTFQTPATHFNIDPRPCFSCSNCLLVPVFLNYFLDRPLSSTLFFARIFDFLDRSFNNSKGNSQRFNEHCQSKAMALSGLHNGY